LVVYKRIDLGLTVTLLVLGVAVIVVAHQTIGEARGYTADPIGPRGFAYLIGGFVIGCAVLLLASQLSPAARKASAAELEAENGGDDPRYPASARRAFLLVAATAGYALVLEAAGYLVATPVYLATCMWVMGARRPARLIVFPVVFAVTTYLCFDPLLGVRLPGGVLDPVLKATDLT
jgi:putative tricarboxylic transport membrane protein